MKIVQKFVADDGTEFDDEVECATYEEMMPFAGLLTKIDEAAAISTSFAWEIEVRGRKLAKARIDRGDAKRTRKPSETPAPAAPEAPTPEAPFDPAIDVSVEKLEREGYFGAPADA
jgi:hypothetical protein